VRNLELKPLTAADIDGQVAKVLRDLGSPEPPLDLRLVVEVLQLDRGYYSTTDDSVLRETLHRLKVAGIQVLKRPTLLSDAIRKLNLKALYLPDRKRILLDSDLPKTKHRWNEGHEIGHSIIPWHGEMMLGDHEQTLTPACQALIEAEANYAAGRLLFLADQFPLEANASSPDIDEVLRLSKRFQNSKTSTLWRYVEQAHADRPMFGLVTGHPHRSRRDASFDPASPCRYFIRSPSFVRRFSNSSECDLFAALVSYCGPQRGGPLGEDQVPLLDDNGTSHLFRCQTFFNGHEALTLGLYLRPMPVVV
jgi:Zn-dependent peptidase ImmA (M78 family)